MGVGAEVESLRVGAEVESLGVGAEVESLGLGGEVANFEWSDVAVNLEAVLIESVRGILNVLGLRLNLE